MKNAWLLWAALCVVSLTLFTPGCGNSSSPPALVGRVGVGYGETGMSPDLPRGDDETFEALTDVDILLTFDKEGKDPVPGLKTQSDAFGYYFLDTTNLPPAKNTKWPPYYLVVSKSGYEPLIEYYSKGHRYKYQKNTVYLKKSDEERGR